MKRRIALAGLLLSALCWGADAPLLVPCPGATELLPEQLYGLWSAQFHEPGQGRAHAKATLRLERSADYAQGVSGTLARDGVAAMVSGDAQEGEFTLDESQDGVAISATWVGSVTPDACGREIRGNWYDVVKKSTLDFVLRKLPENRR